MDDNEKARRDMSESGVENAPSIMQDLKLDHARYMEMADDFDMTEAQKRELLETPWSIMLSFARLGFDGEQSLQAMNHIFSLSDPDSLGVDSGTSTSKETR